MSESEKGNSALYLWKFGVKHVLMFSRSQIRMGKNDRVGTDELYMDRWLCEIGPGRRSIRLHIIYREDTDNCLHDHPWPFLALVLWGGYLEEIPSLYGSRFGAAHRRQAQEAAGFPIRRIVEVRPFRLHWRPAGYKHRIIKLLRRFSVTLAFAGPIKNHWGFFTNHGKEQWEDFVTKDHATRVPWCSTK